MMIFDFGFWILDFGLSDLRRAPRSHITSRLNPKSKINNRKSRLAFTLLEVLIAIALILALGAALFGFLHDMLATRSRTLDHALQQRAAATLVERLESDVVTTLVGDSRSGPGVQGEATRLRLLTRGVMPQLASRGLDDPAPLGDLQTVEYRFDAGARRLEARKFSASAGESPTVFAPLGGEVAHIRFRYLDQHRWQESFDSRTLGRLPAAIEVAVWFNPWPQDQEQSETAALADSPAASSPSADDSRANANAFDERAFGMTSDNESQHLPPPDRLRVIVIPDGGADDVAPNGTTDEHG